jgi:hypothetical protein
MPVHCITYWHSTFAMVRCPGHSEVSYIGVDYLLDLLDLLDGETETIGKLPFLPSNRLAFRSNRLLFRPIDCVAHVAFELLPAGKKAGK